MARIITVEKNTRATRVVNSIIESTRRRQQAKRANYAPCFQHDSYDAACNDCRELNGLPKRG